MSRSCDACGHVGTDVAPTLAESDAGAYGTMDRCRDRAACRDRVVAVVPVEATDVPYLANHDGPLDADATPDDADAGEEWDFDA